MCGVEMNQRHWAKNPIRSQSIAELEVLEGSQEPPFEPDFVTRRLIEFKLLERLRQPTYGIAFLTRAQKFALKRRPLPKQEIFSEPA